MKNAISFKTKGFIHNIDFFWQELLFIQRIRLNCNGNVYIFCGILVINNCNIDCVFLGITVINKRKLFLWLNETWTGPLTTCFGPQYFNNVNFKIYIFDFAYHWYPDFFSKNTFIFSDSC